MNKERILTLLIWTPLVAAVILPIVVPRGGMAEVISNIFLTWSLSALGLAILWTLVTAVMRKLSR